MTKTEEILNQLRSELGVEFVAADVVGPDGLSVAGVSADSSFDSNVASARLAMAMRLAHNVSQKLNLGDVEDTLATTEKHQIICRFLEDEKYFLALTVTKDATLGMVRILLNDYASIIWQSLPH